MFLSSFSSFNDEKITSITIKGTSITIRKSQLVTVVTVKFMN